MSRSTRSRAERFARPLAAAERRIASGLPGLVDSLLDLACGEIARELPDGTRVYARPPNGRAAAYLIDRIMGKPTQTVEVSGPNGGPMVVETAELAKAGAELQEWRERMQEMVANLPSAPPAGFAA